MNVRDLPEGPQMLFGSSSLDASKKERDARDAARADNG